MIKCPYCGSKHIFKYRNDSDWAIGGDFTKVNPKENYTEEEMDYDTFYRPDIETYFCNSCYEWFVKQQIVNGK